MILHKLKPNELIIMQYTEEEPEKGESDKYAGLGIGVAGLLAENLACHPFIILRRQCQVVTITGGSLCTLFTNIHSVHNFVHYLYTIEAVHY